MPWLSTFDIRQLDDTYFLLLDNLVYYSIKHGIKIVAPSDSYPTGLPCPEPLLYIGYLGTEEKEQQ